MSGPEVWRKKGAADDVSDLIESQYEPGVIFNKSQNKFQDPAKLRRLIVDLIDKENRS